ncbi:AraC family transcriptional regulator [Lichenibacterium minor]|uniref:AraC family transcriptional regulator n=1 Tax=Lichenibacterium minor TaxID=2316528 RepID=A0A4Q2U184_9HYPH|nr:AraC family transcriptional regulator [Lichenibacterium minor]RYC29840.1 AraC family transcriptional regulator [Lichenibacterium minor]
MAPGRPSIFRFLSASPRARTVATIDLGFGRSAAVWRNDLDRVAYEGAEGHTFSLYLEGGAGTRRVDGRPAGGRPGAFCVMPHGASSEWEITAPFAFVHLYLPAGELRRAFAESQDRDARLLDVPEMTFAEAPRVAEPLRALAGAVLAGDPLAAEAAMAGAVSRFLAEPRHGGRRRDALTGGLAPHLGRRVVDHVEAHLGAPLRLRDLAAIAGLSDAHFQRDFAASRGVSPQVFVAHRRIARAKAMLRGRDPVAGIALACGFSSQSHLTRAFKAATGVTPGAYRAMA